MQFKPSPHKENEEWYDSQSTFENQIKKITSQNHQLNNRIKQKQAENDNLKKENKIINKEIQEIKGQENELDIVYEINELREKELGKWQLRYESLQQEQQRLKREKENQLTKKQQLNSELKGWRQRYQDLDSERILQIENSRNTLDKQRLKQTEEIKKKYQQRINQLENDLLMASHEYDKLSSLVLKQNNEQNKQSKPKPDRNLNDVLVQLQQRQKQLEEQIQESSNYILEDSQQEYQIIEEKNKYLMQENQKLFLQNQTLSRQIAINSK